MVNHDDRNELPTFIKENFERLDIKTHAHNHVNIDQWVVHPFSTILADIPEQSV
jgi:hypothetical protein